MRDDRVVTDLVITATNGDKQAWDALVGRCAPLVWSICRRHQLGDTDAGNVGQIVWLRLLDHLSLGCPWRDARSGRKIGAGRCPLTPTAA